MDSTLHAYLEYNGHAHQHRPRDNSAEYWGYDKMDRGYSMLGNCMVSSRGHKNKTKNSAPIGRFYFQAA